MGKKAPQQAKAAARIPSTASGPKQPRQAKNNKDVSYDSLRDPLDRELALVGLRVKQITADGNCFFRALSDQLEGGEGQHSSLRTALVNLMKERHEDFAPFVEDNQKFDAYIARMKKEGVWAGHMELQAASLLLQANIHVYQAGQPRWAIMNFPQGSREFHISYHDGEHYNSVRRADDYNTGPPQLIESLAAAAAAAGSAVKLKQLWSAADESIVAAGTGCDNKALIQQQLEAAGGDVDVAIEAIIEILANEDQPDDQEQRQQDGLFGAALQGSLEDAASHAAVGAEPEDQEVTCEVELQQQKQEGAALKGSRVNAASHTGVGAKPLVNGLEVACEGEPQQQRKQQEALLAAALQDSPVDAASCDDLGAQPIGEEVACEMELPQQQPQQQQGEGLHSHAKEVTNCNAAATINEQSTDLVAKESSSLAGASEHHVLGQTSSRVEEGNHTSSSTVVGQKAVCSALASKQGSGVQPVGKALTAGNSHQKQHKQAGTASKKGVRLKGKAGTKTKGIQAPADEDSDKRPSRNKPCPCGSGRKHKHCCGMKSSGGSAGSKAGAGTTVGLPAQISTLHI